jgi:ankyrin repeat protein
MNSRKIYCAISLLICCYLPSGAALAAEEDDMNLSETALETELETTEDGMSLGGAVLVPTEESLNLRTVAGLGDLKTFKMMLEAGANPNARDMGQNTAILMAAYHSQREMVRRLLDLGVDVNVLGSIGYTPIGVAAKRNDSEIVKMLIGAKAQLDVHDHAGGTPLTNAIRFRRDENIKLLLQAGADVNIADGMGNTPLMLAAKAGRLDYVEMLLAQDVHLSDPEHDPDPMGIIDADPMSISSAEPIGNTALYYAISGDHHDISKRLIQAGADVRGLCDGYTVLHWAKAKGQTEIVALLKNAGAIE